jgi:hypothetical protein
VCAYRCKCTLGHHKAALHTCNSRGWRRATPQHGQPPPRLTSQSVWPAALPAAAAMASGLHPSVGCPPASWLWRRHRCLRGAISASRMRVPRSQQLAAGGASLKPNPLTHIALSVEGVGIVEGAAAPEPLCEQGADGALAAAAHAHDDVHERSHAAAGGALVVVHWGGGGGGKQKRGRCSEADLGRASHVTHNTSHVTR